jgi:ribosome modulation factor
MTKQQDTPFHGEHCQLAFLFILEGRHAALAGQSTDENPYDPESLEGGFWLQGWNEGYSKGSSITPQGPCRRLGLP